MKRTYKNGAWRIHYNADGSGEAVIAHVSAPGVVHVPMAVLIDFVAYAQATSGDDEA